MILIISVLFFCSQAFSEGFIGTRLEWTKFYKKHLPHSRFLNDPNMGKLFKTECYSYTDNLFYIVLIGKDNNLQDVSIAAYMTHNSNTDVHILNLIGFTLQKVDKSLTNWYLDNLAKCTNITNDSWQTTTTKNGLDFTLLYNHQSFPDGLGGEDVTIEVELQIVKAK
jgi:hypothetical protein